MKGVIGAYSKQNAAIKGLHILYGVQHRGQESSGMSVAGDYSLRTRKSEGLVSNVFDDDFLSFIHPTDYVVIGAASGEDVDNVKVIPPVEFEAKDYRMSLAIDGKLCGGVVPEGLFGHALGINLSKLGNNLSKDPIETALAETMKELHYIYYSLVAVVHHKNSDYSELYAARDQRGIKPLYMARNDLETFITSESPPIDVLENMGIEITERYDVTPGSLIKVDSDGPTTEQVLEPKPAHCAFEWVYFGRPDSIIEGRNVHSVRKRLGQALVETHSLKKELEGDENVVIIPVPDSGRSVHSGVIEALGIPGDEGVIKNAYLGRTYIIPDPESRKTASDLKHNIIKEVVKDKKVIITDDSIVRGTVSESIAQGLRKAGAAEVEYLVSYAPIFYPCFPDSKDKPLAAAPYKDKSFIEVGNLVASKLPSINKVKYNSVESVVKAIGLLECDICTMCITGNDPFE